jgi:hypothetical protein
MDIALKGIRIRQCTYGSDMAVNAGNSLVCIGFLQLGCDNLLDGEDDAVLAPDAD